MPDYDALIVLESKIAYLATAWDVRGLIEKGRTHVAFRLTDRGAVFTLGGRYHETQKALAALCPDCRERQLTYCWHAKPNLEVSALDSRGFTHPLTIKRCVIAPAAPQPARQNNPSSGSGSGSPDDFDRLLDAMTKMATLSMQDYYPS
ncbi:Uncharacterised protein [Mycobacteroides abscessus subsp. abscessus]|uniref:hypothetical protein n=1 Tax=Mycobacteroides abscessus TaxID=36809 RepID=UPI0009A61ECD|nr:hypothetical protein [Mycobacteroides abscessus]MBN7355517.1 hypothetical protein [Mycobacteroides abscessus subsp. abscessus]MBN7360296.1 hypothetical protein [Mycobacteroides abscessus subsp. abscessus]MBN7476891.1 hypothetical protein [Mycobacteroides abscessus subsp. abscessus]SLI66476.1 Uncharacterised protein [Mycobacteroides abscessus subsp. abscessus]